MEWGGEGAGLAGAAALLAFPTAFFLAAFYTESMFLLFAVATLWGARRGHWVVAGVAAGGASLTRFNGFVLVAALAAYALDDLRRAGRKPTARHFAAFALASAGAAAYPLYLWKRFGDPMLYVRSKMMGWPVPARRPLDVVVAVCHATSDAAHGPQAGARHCDVLPGAVSDAHGGGIPSRTRR